LDPRIVVAGFGEIIERDTPLTVYELYQKAVNLALESSGINQSDIDGLITTSLIGIYEEPPFRCFWPDQVSYFLGIKPRFIDFVEFGGPSYEEFIIRAYHAIKCGDAKTVLCVGGGKGSVRKKNLIPSSMYSNSWFSSLYYWDDFKPISDYAMLAALHSQRYGTTDSQRATLAVAQRENALKNPNALYNKPISVDDVLSSPIISSPLHLLEIVPVMDGAHAFIVTSNPSISKNPPVRLVSYGEGHDPSFLAERDDILELPIDESIRNALKGNNESVSLADIDFFELYDSFTITTLLQLEALEFVPRGKVGKFIEDTDFSISGSVPLNTGGGSLNVGQTGYMSGGIILAEALRQLMEQAGSHQVKGARLGLVNGVGGNDTINHSITLILSNVF
jgi:acetyl-CoA acetyltransferase